MIQGVPRCVYESLSHLYDMYEVPAFTGDFVWCWVSLLECECQDLAVLCLGGAVKLLFWAVKKEQLQREPCPPQAGIHMVYTQVTVAMDR